MLVDYAKTRHIPTYSYAQLELFTNFFDEENVDGGGNLLGEGGYGKVFFGEYRKISVNISGLLYKMVGQIWSQIRSLLQNY